VKRIREKYINCEKWERMKDFSVILDAIFRAWPKPNDHSNVVEDSISIFMPEKKSVFSLPRRT